MLYRTEEYLKRIAKKRKYTVSLKTELVHYPTWPAGERTLSWLVPKLDYAWQFVFDNKTTAKGQRRFCLTSQRIPTRVEVELDAEVENEWWREGLEPLHSLYLRSKHDLLTTEF